MCANNGKTLTAGCARGTIDTIMMGRRLCPQPNAFNKSRCTAGGIRAVQRLFAGVRPAAHVSNRCKSGIRPVVGRI